MSTTGSDACTSQIRITREALGELGRALEQYREVLAELEAAGTRKPNAAKTHILHSENFVRWLKDESEPGARNKASSTLPVPHSVLSVPPW